MIVYLDAFFSDEERPVLVCPDNILVDTDVGENYATVTWFPANVTDNSGESITLTLTGTSGDQFNVGAVTVNVSAQDSSGNAASCSFTVTVQGEWRHV